MNYNRIGRSFNKVIEEIHASMISGRFNENEMAFH